MSSHSTTRTSNTELNLLKDFGGIHNDYELFGQYKHQDFSMFDEGNQYLALLDIPGVKKQNIDINWEKNILKVVARRSDLQGICTYHSSLIIPDNVDQRSIETSAENGVLKILLNKVRDKNENDSPYNNASLSAVKGHLFFAILTTFVLFYSSLVMAEKFFL